MGERELGKALLELDATSVVKGADVRRQTQVVLDRDRRWLRLVSAMTVTVWLLATFLVCSGLVSFGLTFPRQAKLVQDIDNHELDARERDQVQREVLVSFQKGSLLIAFSVGVMALAALCTMGLIMLSRRTTLRHMNAGLLEIASELAQLRETLAMKGG
jgi:hypothetical protein